MAELPHRYQRLAEELAETIARGLLRPGERLPSVRQACAHWGLSPATVFQAYARLESEGLIEARPRSGFYVRAARAVPPVRAMPVAVATRADAQAVALSEQAFALLAAATDTTRVPLGSAFPAPQLYPFAALARCGARAMRRLPPEAITSAQIAGDPELRQALLRRHALQGLALRDEELLITNGALEALNLCLQAVTRPGDVVAVESPTFYAALQVLERQGLRAVELPTDPREGVDLDALAALLQRRGPDRPAACWLMPSFQNPLGALMPVERKQALVRLITAQQLPLIEDDVYAELYAGHRRPPSAKSFDREGWVLHCGSFSKSLAPGYRVGWAAAGRFAERVLRLKGMASLASSLPAQRAIAEYLAEGGYERHLRQLREALSEGRGQGLRAVEQHFPAGTRCTRPEGGYFLWLELPPAVDVLELQRRAQADGISLAPGTLFSADGRFRHHLRLNVGHPGDPRIDAALRRLGALAAA
jgi:DNA-binding transcriptional MocR family regulator